MENSFQELLQPHLALIKVPNAGSKIFKDECMYSFDNPVITICSFLISTHYEFLLLQCMLHQSDCQSVLVIVLFCFCHC